MAEMQPITDENMAPVEGGAYISKRFRDAGDVKAAAPAGNYTLAGIFSIIAFLAFVLMLWLLYQDFNALALA